MKKIKINTGRWHFAKMLFFSSALVILLTQCEIQENFEYQHCTTTGELGVTAWEFIQNQDDLSLLEEAITATGLESYYSGSTEYSFILPGNSAFTSYLSTNGYSSISEVPVPILKNVLLYHIVTGKVLFTDEEFYSSTNPIAFSTLNGQIMYLSRNSNYQGIINYGTNKSWTISTSNLEPTNGAIHILYNIVYYSAVTGSTDIPDASYASDTIFATQDAYVRAATYADNNFGGADDLTLRVDNESSVNDRKVFLKFDLSELSQSENVREAYLNIGAYYAAGKVQSINLQNVQDNSWSESSITWNNMPSPDTEVFASTVSKAITNLSFDIFSWECTDYVSSKLESPGIVSIMINAELGTNDGIMFVSKENTTYSYPAMLVAVYSNGSSLEMGTNTGLSVTRQGTVVLTTDKLSMEGAAAADVVYTLKSAPTDGWLIMGAKILTAGDKFGQLDIDAGNIVYINEGNASSDSFTVSVNDKDGGSISPFAVNITIN